MTRRTLLWLPLLLLATLMSACTNLSGEVEIVATAPSAMAVAQSDVPLPDAAPNIANGQRLYEQNCVRCHAANGNGQGELVESGEVPAMPSFLDVSHMREQSPSAYYDIITNGNLENLMPPWGDALSIQERWDVAMYVYTLHYTPEQLAAAPDLTVETDDTLRLASDGELYEVIQAQNADLSEDEAWAAVAAQRVQSLRNAERVIAGETIEPPDSATITGTVTNGTEGAEVPDDFQVLLVTESEGEFQSIEPTTFDGTTYTFEDVGVNPDGQYFIAAQHDERPFTSEFLIGSALEETTELPLTIYNVTEDPSVVVQREMNVRIEELNVPELGTGLVFTQTNVYENTSSESFSLLPPGQNRTASLLVELPPGSVIVSIDQSRYLVSQEQYTIVDTQAVPPGRHEIRVTYFVPYEDGAFIDLPTSRAFDGTLNIELLPASLSIASETLQPVEDTTIEQGNAEESLTRYQGTFQREVNGAISFEIVGSLYGSENTSTSGTTVTGDVLLPLVIGVLMVLALAVGGLFWWQSGNNLDDDIAKISQQLQRLEKMHEDGRINHDVYQRQRADLEERLDALLAQARDDAPVE